MESKKLIVPEIGKKRKAKRVKIMIDLHIVVASMAVNYGKSLK